MPNESKAVIQKQSRVKWVNIGIFFSTLAVIITIFAASYGYTQLAVMTATLAKVISSVENELTQTQDNFVTLHQSVGDLTAVIKKSQELANKQEKILAAWQAAQEGNLDKWYIAEAQYLVRLANDYAQLPASPIVITLLQRAEQALQPVKDNRVVTIQRSLASDISSLQNTPPISVHALYLQLSTLDKQLNQLPLPIMQFKPESTSSSDGTKTNVTWWQKGLDRSWQMLKQIVVVHYNGSNTLPLVIPDEKIFLYQNLHAQIENAMWGLLHQDVTVYQTSMQRAIDWIRQYFVQDAEVTQNMLQNLQTLQKINIQPSLTNFSTTLQLFDGYFTEGTPSFSNVGIE
ncbi:MAG TPA: uroporphyrinogen-III C-methyltransferase [Gammaproteobacteria bacterium]|nr:uroporphyrinogen-III C-methyltransferase [Gammaproteobacteria bacterium]